MKVYDLIRIMGGRTKVRILDDRYEYLPLFEGCIDENYENFGGRDMTMTKENTSITIHETLDYDIDLYDLEIVNATVINGEDVLTINVDVTNSIGDNNVYLNEAKNRAIKHKWIR